MRAHCVGVRLISYVWLGLAASAALAQKSPEDELATLKVADGIDVSLFASEPMITNPSCIDVDTQGRVWVAEIQWYRAAAKNPPADKIKVLEDTDHDGKADKMTVFADGVFAPMSLCVAGDKVYAVIRGSLLVWEDKNGDLKADGPPKTILSGFANADHDHTSHSIVLGPDHKWYMSHGDLGLNAVGTDGSKISSRWGAMVRGELDGSKLEVIANNFRNPYEICLNSFGEAFCSDNDRDGSESVRICWILEGGNYGWYGSPPFDKPQLDQLVPVGTPFREAWHFRGHIPGHVPGTLVTGFGSPTGICCYEGDAFGEKFKNAPLHTDCGPRVVRVYPHTPWGAGMKATSEVWLTNEGDNFFRPDDICTAPDGSLYVADWYDGGVGGHAYNNPDQGRIFLVRPLGKKLVRHEKPGPYTNVPDAIEGLKSPNLDTQFLARERFLAEGQASIPALQSLLKDEEPNNRARALWLLDRIGGPARQLVVDELKSEDPAFRALAVRILRRHGDLFADQILAMASDKNDEVLREVVLACGKISGDKPLKVLASIVAGWDGTDRFMLEAINIAAGENKPKLYSELDASGQLSFVMLPLLELLNPQAAAAMVTARLSQSGLDEATLKSLVDAAAGVSSLDAGRTLLAMVANDATAKDLRQMALAKFTTNLAGSWKALAAEQPTLDVFKKLIGDAAFQPILVGAIGSLGIRPLSTEVLAVAASANVDPALRQRAISAAATLNARGTANALRPLLSDGDATVRQAALNAIVDLQDIKLLRELLTSGTFPDAQRVTAAKRLLETAGGALVLLRLVDSGALSPQLKQLIITSAATHPDSNIRTLYEKYVPEDQRPKKLGGAIRPEEILALAGDPRRGRQIFTQSSAAQCKSCHMIQGAGSNVGPDLSMIGRKYERAALLDTILNPSKGIAHDYQAYLLETSSGQVFVGFLAQKNDQEVVLKDIKGKLIHIPLDEVEALVVQEKSLMPELVLQEVSAQDAGDLLAFLTTLTEGVQTAGAFRLLGPFSIPPGDLDGPLEPEKSIGAPDLNAVFKGPGDRPLRWEVVQTTVFPFPAIDTVQYDNARGVPNSNVAHYFLVVANSASAQHATLQIGSDDGVKVWHNGRELFKNNTSRGLAANQDQVSVDLQPGRNVLVFKVVNGQGPGGFSLGVVSPEPVELRTE